MSDEWFQRPRRWGATKPPPWHLVAKRSRLSSLRIAECGVDTYHAHERAIIASEPGGNVCRACWAAFRRTLSPDQDQPDRSE